MHNGAQNVAPQQHRSEKRLRELDVLRGIAALGVLCCHYASECKDLGHLERDFRLGSYGPHLFFLISGFVIFMTLQRCARPSDFLFSRFSRLYPIYWVGVLFSSVIIVIWPSIFESTLTVPQLVANLTMCQTWLKIPDIEVSYWTLSVELKFYVLMFAVLVLRKCEKIESILVGWLGAVVVFHIVDRFVGLPHVLGTPLIVNQAHLFAAGIMFYRLRTLGSSWLRHGLILSAIPIQWCVEGSESALLVSLFIATFYLFIGDMLRWVVVRPLTVLGDVSYPLYLIHGAFGVAVMQYLHGLGVSTFVLMVVPILLSIVIAVLLTYFVERPVLKGLRDWYRRPRQKPTGASWCHSQ